MAQALAIATYLLVGLVLYTQVGYALLIYPFWLAFGRRPLPPPPVRLPFVSAIVAAHNEERVIEEKVANLRSLDYPKELLEVIVSCDGCTDRTAALARAAGADLVVEGPREGKVRAQDRAVAQAKGELLAFSDANSSWEAGALKELIRPFSDPNVGYACGQVRYLTPAGATSGEGLYWRFELFIRRMESDLCSVTGGNGGIYAVRREAYLVVDPVMGHDLSFPFNMVKRGWRALYVPTAVARELMVPTVEGEFARKRRMMSHTWPIVVRGGLLSPRGYPLRYLVMVLSHRLLRYLCPFLHLLALACSAAAAGVGAGLPVLVLLWLQGAGIVAFLGGRYLPLRPLLLVRHYLLGQAAILLGLYDWLRHGTAATWTPPAETR